MFKRSPKTEPQEKKPSFAARLRARVNKGQGFLTRDVRDLFVDASSRDEFFDELEMQLLQSDVGVNTTESLLDVAKETLRVREQADFESLKAALKAHMLERLKPVIKPYKFVPSDTPTVILMVGVNGAGKTTTTAKLASKFKQEGRSVMLAAADTFRAAATEQLQAWGERLDVPVIAQATGADPAAVVFDALQAATARNVDVLLADTAGRLHTQTHLMDELRKVKRILKKQDEHAPHHTWLVVDATQGQNALAQVEFFNEAVPLSGLIVTKLDGSAKGGVLFALSEQFKLPIVWVGVGESENDLGAFDADAYCDGLLGDKSSDNL